MLLAFDFKDMFLLYRKNFKKWLKIDFFLSLETCFDRIIQINTVLDCNSGNFVI